MNQKRSRIIFSIYFLLVIPGLYFLAEDNIGYFIDRRLSKQDIQVESTGADFDLLSRSVAFDKITFSSDQYGSISFVDLKVRKINLLSMLPAFGFKAESVSMDSLLIALEQESIEADTSKQMFQLSGKHFGVDRLDIAYGQFDYTGEDNSTQFVFKLEALRGDMGEGVSQGLLTLHDLQHRSLEAATLVTLDSLWVDLDLGQLLANGIHYKSSLDQAAFVDQFPHQRDWVDLALPSLKMNGMDLSEWEANGFQCERVSLDSAEIKIYKDKTLTESEKSDMKLLIDQLKEIPLLIHLDTVTVIQASVSYREKHGVDRMGNLHFDRLYASIYNLNTTPDMPVIMDAQASFQEAGRLNAHFEFQPSPGQTKVNGTLSAMDMKKVNEMTISSFGVKVKSGWLSDLDFDFQYDEHQSKGLLHMHYDDLALQFVDHSNETRNLNQNLSSFLANAFVIKKKNQPGQINYKEGPIAFVRDKSKLDIGYWWRSLQTGIMASVRMNKPQAA
ncbi:DUF748 domain-containing protein [Reichenbachiella ulvae]|uniref:DUF748 domain-containing protein n=1 Tax=Reichenbachiella ulvae TaxID=2980104 RepID=A0ABT3D0W6_9BACT|nr:DUF748 domain-containing protein [Reichenbachiella ulvae]MCV9389419.1 DUF748 domain-containing protein [Reichenbachiella ulvae]